jgi:glycosyltransferase involved in cell wall biosynthesis
LKKVLIVTYYWPPSGGPGVQRWLKFVKYLKDYGWQPVVYTVESGEYALIDNSLEQEIGPDVEVIKKPIWEPFTAYKKLVGIKGNQQLGRDALVEDANVGLLKSLAIWIRGNVFIPDARKFWVSPSVKFLQNFILENNIEAIITTGPPHSLHLIGLKLKKKLNIPWLADFRDPWTTIDYYKSLKLSKWADEKHHRLEKEVLYKADAVVVVGNAMKEEFEGKSNRKVEVIMNGFDKADTSSIENVPLDKEFTIVHAGSFLKRRNPEVLWEVLEGLINENAGFKEKLKIKLIGKVDGHVLESLKKHQLDGHLELLSYVPHSEVIRHQKAAQVLLLPIDNFEGAKWVLTGKLFEYLAAKRPVLCIGPEDGDAASVIAQTSSGFTVGFDEHHKLKELMRDLYQSFEDGKLEVENTGVEKFERRELTRQLAGLLTEITK